MWMKYIGTNESMGLKHGEYYYGYLSIHNNSLLCLEVKKGIYYMPIFYSTLGSLLENWSVIKSNTREVSNDYRKIL